MHCPRAPTLEPSKGRRPKNRHSLKSGKVNLFSADRGHHVPAPKGGMSGRLCLVCVSLLCLLVALVGRSWCPVALGFCPGVLRYEGADPRTGRFCQVPPRITVFCIWAAPCFCSSYVLGRFVTRQHHADIYGRHPGGTHRERRARVRHPRFFALHDIFGKLCYQVFHHKSVHGRYSP